jgi:hypothetical protein
MNSCAVGIASSAVNAAAGAASATAAIQAGLNVPNDVAVMISGIFWAGSGIIDIHLKLCQAFGKDGVYYAKVGGSIYPWCG